LTTSQYPLILQHNSLPTDDAKERFREENQDGLAKELRALGSSSAVARVRQNNPAWTPKDYDPVGEVERKYAKPQWEEHKLKGPSAPDKPMGLDEDEARSALGDNGVQRVLAQYPDDDALKAASNKARAEAGRLEVQHGTSHPDVERQWKQVARLERARAARAKIPAANVATPTLGGTPAQSIEQKFADQWRAASNSPDVQAAQAAVMDHPDFAHFTEAEKYQMAIRANSSTGP
jgi:hypothetical protein